MVPVSVMTVSTEESILPQQQSSLLLNRVVVLSVMMTINCLTTDAHVHVRSANDGQGLHDNKVVRDAEHINEHLQGQTAMNVSQMTAEELEFYYFKLHDTDNNTKLDGLEIYKAMVHMLPIDEIETIVHKTIDTKGKTGEEVERERRNQEMKYYSDIVDNVMRADDIDDDGYLTYPEYIIARRREEAEDDAERGGGGGGRRNR